MPNRLDHDNGTGETGLKDGSIACAKQPSHHMTLDGCCQCPTYLSSVVLPKSRACLAYSDFHVWPTLVWLKNSPHKFVGTYTLAAYWLAVQAMITRITWLEECSSLGNNTGLRR